MTHRADDRWPENPILWHALNLLGVVWLGAVCVAEHFEDKAAERRCQK